LGGETLIKGKLRGQVKQGFCFGGSAQKAFRRKKGRKKKIKMNIGEKAIGRLYLTGN